MTYRLFIMPSAEKEMRRLPSAILRRIHFRIQALAEEPRPRGSRKLEGSEHQYRLRIGNYRVLYSVDDRFSAITVHAVAHRREAYR